MNHNPRLLYTETHYALAALLLFLLDRADDSLMDLAESRLRLWSREAVPLTFFNSMAICLLAIVFKRSGEKHGGLQSILEELVEATPRRHRDVAYRQYCGNNAYLQQVTVDAMLLPIALGENVADENITDLLDEFHRYRTPEGFFYDLPRSGTAQEALHPPTYVMKMLFLAGVCQKLRPGEEFSDLFQTGMRSVLPLLTWEGTFSYFGRTDNSPFAAGLTIFNLRSAEKLCSERSRDFREACTRAEHYYRTFPRTPTGMLQSNRFSDPRSPYEASFSRDDYAYVGQYSLASCAYALLGCYWFPVSENMDTCSTGRRTPTNTTVRSNDLCVVRLSRQDHDLFLRTGSQVTSWDRRYLGPTILRYQIENRLVVGAIPRTVAADEKVVQRHRPKARIARAVERLLYGYRNGIEQLDGTTVGFLPVMRQGPVDYLPYLLLSLEASSGRLTSRYQMLQLSVRGYHPCFLELRDFFHRNLPGLEVSHYNRPRMKVVDSIEFVRDIFLDDTGCRIEDEITGGLKNKTLLFSVRYCPGASVHVEGLRRQSSMSCWGSDGRQILELYVAPTVEKRVRYNCHIRRGSLESPSVP